MTPWRNETLSRRLERSINYVFVIKKYILWKNVIESFWKFYLLNFSFNKKKKFNVNAGLFVRINSISCNEWILSFFAYLKLPLEN